MILSHGQLNQFVVTKSRRREFFFKRQSQDGSAFLFAQRSGQTLSRKGRHPDQGEDNPNRKGVAGNGRV